MNGFISTAPRYVIGYKKTRFLGYLLFIASVGAYAYAAQYLWVQLIEAAPDDVQMYIYIGALTFCWLGSVLLLWKWFRYYQSFKPGLSSLIVAVLPALILPLAWGVLQVIKYVEISV